jgi:hypothetical protein
VRDFTTEERSLDDLFAAYAGDGEGIEERSRTEEEA